MSFAASPGPTILFDEPVPDDPAGGEPVYVFDLDGTVLTINSFPAWVRYLLAGGRHGASRTARARTALATLAALAERKLARRPHRLLKLRLQRIWKRRADREEAAAEFTERLMAHLREELRPLLSRVARGEIDAVLATAAAEEYAEGVAACLGFSRYTATPRGAADVAENVGAAKRDSVAALLERIGWAGRPLIVLTDHLEDSPLIERASRLVWCGSQADAGHLRSSGHGGRMVALSELEALAPATRFS